MLKGFAIGFFNNLYLIFLVFSVSYFLYYFFITNSKSNETFCELNKSTLTLLKEFSLIIFSAGIFTSSLKYLQYIKVFEKEFERIFNSKNFNEKIKDSVESITFSKEFLHKQNNLEKIWQKVTLIMYEKQFPELYSQLKTNLKNELFKYNNISFYYKNFKIEYHISRISNSDKIKIEELTTYTLVRPNTKLFDWDFKVALDSSECEDKKYPEIEIDFMDSDNKFDTSLNIITKEIDENIVKEIKMKLIGNTNYLIKRKITMIQDLQKDREYSFGSDRIIEDLDIQIQYSDDLNVIFSESWKVKFIKEEKRIKNIKSYIHRGLLLPGEKFKLFFLKED